MEDKNNPEIIEANDLSILAIKYRNCTTAREKNKIFLQIAEFYMPKLRSKLLYNISEQNKDDFMQVYYLEILKALNKWNMTSNFSTYLYLWIKGVYAKFMNSLKTFKQFKYTDENGNISYRPIECVQMADLPEEYEPTYEIDEDEDEELEY